MKRVLITGGAGFIGSHFTRLLVKEGIYTVVLDKLTYAGNLLNLKDLESYENFVFVKGDIADREKVEEIVKEYKIKAIVNFAAETHVDRSILNPEPFYETNIKGTIVLLEVAKKYGLRLLQVSTDEVYGPVLTGYADENYPLNPTSPYSSSKAAADLIALSYFKTFGVDVVITRSSNNFGPNQYPEKFIPVIILSLMEKQKIPVYGNGRQKRDWIYVRDNAIAIREVLFKGRSGEIYNIAGNKEIENIELVNKVIKIYENLTGEEWLSTLIAFVKDRPAHDIRYALSTDKIEKEIGFKPTYPFDIALSETVKWYLDNLDWINTIKTRDFEEYYRKNYGER